MKLALSARHLACLAAAGLSLLAACSVDQSDIVFDKQLPGTGNTGDGGDGTGDVSSGGTKNIAGTTGKSGEGTGGMPAGGMPTGGMPPGGNNAGGNISNGNCQVIAANPAEPMIDDFEDGTPGILLKGGRDGGWYSYNDNSGGTQTPAPMTMPMASMGGAAMTKQAMHFFGQGFKIFGAVIGFSFRAPQMGPPCPYDVSPQKGIKFYLKGKITSDSMAAGAKLLRVQFPTQETNSSMMGGTCNAMCGDHYGWNIDMIPSEWMEIQVPFMNTSQQGTGSKVAFDLAHVTNVEFVAAQNTNFDFWVDQISFY